MCMPMPASHAHQMRGAFDAGDLDGNGQIDFDEFQKMMARLGRLNLLVTSHIIT